MNHQRLLARFYDPIAAVGLREPELADRMFALLGAPRRILHLGCGRGWLTRRFAARYPACEVIGLDADAEIIACARELGGRVRYVVGRAEAPPVARSGSPDRAAPPNGGAESIEGPFDAIVSSLLFHHVPRAAKRDAFAAATRLLAPGGRVLIADFARPHDLLMRVAYLPVQLADGFADTADNLDGSYVRMLAAAGLRDVREEGHVRTPLGTVALYQAQA